MSAADYRLHASQQEWRPLFGTAVPTPWDPGLGEEMATLGVAVHEEGMLATLLADLR